MGHCCSMDSLGWTLVLLVWVGVCRAEIQRMCISCGFPKVSPDNDVYGSYGVEPGMKRYNHSCEEYDSLPTPGADPFVRICPLGVKSCFYITGKYGDQKLIFRGCAEAMDEIDQRGASKQVDVDINICFCSSQNCNEVISRGDTQHAAITWAVVMATVILMYY